MKLQASAAYTLCLDPSGKTATQLAGCGYQKQFTDIGQVHVLPDVKGQDFPTNRRGKTRPDWLDIVKRSIVFSSYS